MSEPSLLAREVSCNLCGPIYFLFFLKSCVLFMIHEVGCEGKSALFMPLLCCTALVVSVKGLFKQHALLIQRVAYYKIDEAFGQRLRLLHPVRIFI